MRPADSPPPRKTTEPRRSGGWIVLVARGQSKLYENLRHALRRDDKVEVMMDRRRDLRRNPPLVNGRLSVHGVAVIRRQP
jgi:hypothetical protein